MIENIQLYIMLTILPLALNWPSVKFTNVKCTDYDPTALSTETCFLKLVQRGVVGMNVHVKLYEKPVSNVTVNLSFQKRLNGYKPFLYNITVDFCKFMKSRSSYPLFKIFFDILARSSNVNHTCPYNHDIIIHNWILRESDFILLPFPEGDYVLRSKIGLYNYWKTDIDGYFSVK